MKEKVLTSYKWDISIGSGKTGLCSHYEDGKEIDFNKIKEFDLAKLNDYKLTGELVVLERLKTILPESYYNWQMIQRNFK